MCGRLRGRRPWMAGHSGEPCWVFLSDFPASCLVCLFKLAQQGLKNPRVFFFFFTISCADMALGSNHTLPPPPNTGSICINSAG